MTLGTTWKFFLFSTYLAAFIKLFFSWCLVLTSLYLCCLQDQCVSLLFTGPMCVSAVYKTRQMTPSRPHTVLALGIWPSALFNIFLAIFKWWNLGVVWQSVCIYLVGTSSLHQFHPPSWHDSSGWHLGVVLLDLVDAANFQCTVTGPIVSTGDLY